MSQRGVVAVRELQPPRPLRGRHGPRHRLRRHRPEGKATQSFCCSCRLPLPTSPSSRLLLHLNPRTPINIPCSVVHSDQAGHACEIPRKPIHPDGTSPCAPIIVFVKLFTSSRPVKIPRVKLFALVFTLGDLHTAVKSLVKLFAFNLSTPRKIVPFNSCLSYLRKTGKMPRKIVSFSLRNLRTAVISLVKFVPLTGV